MQGNAKQRRQEGRMKGNEFVVGDDPAAVQAGRIARLEAE
jgi:hypothetical protein